MQTAIHLHVILLAALALVAGLLFMVAPRIYQWTRDAHWIYPPWHRPPEPGSFRAWALRSRPRLERFFADVSTTFLLFGACKLLVALTLVVQHEFPIS